MKKKLVQFLFSKKGVGVLDELEQKLQVGTRTEVIKIAISLLWWAIEHTKDGGKVAVVRDGDAREVDIAPFWELRPLDQVNLKEFVAEEKKPNRDSTKSPATTNMLKLDDRN